jgi:hypothetical protein
VEREPLPLQPAEPVLADEFPVGQQGSDLGGAEDLEEALHQGDALGGVEIPCLVEEAPEERHHHSSVGDAEHKERGCPPPSR